MIAVTAFDPITFSAMIPVDDLQFVGIAHELWFGTPVGGVGLRHGSNGTFGMLFNIRLL